MMKREVAELVVEAAFIALGLRPQKKPTRQQWRKIYDDANPVQKWRCCSKPVKKLDRKRQPYWGSMCSYKRGNEQATVWRKVSEGPKKPNKVVIDGKNIKWC